METIKFLKYTSKPALPTGKNQANGRLKKEEEEKKKTTNKQHKIDTLCRKIVECVLYICSYILIYMYINILAHREITYT